MMLLHGEENLEIYKSITPGETYKIEPRIADVVDKGKFALVHLERLIKNEKTNELYAKCTSSLIIRGNWGFKNEGTIKMKYPKIPERQPDFVIEEKLTPGLAFLYRLNGDSNPLHVDPDMAEMGGFSKPILHGLCTYGVTTRLIYEKYFNGEP